jgi:membrane-associated phospholipid phosphatase
MTALVILAVGMVTAIGAAWYSIRHHGEMPLDPDAEERRLVRALRSHPRLAACIARRLDRASVGGLLLTVSVSAIFVLALLAGWIFDTLDEQSGFAQFDESVAEWGAANATDTSTTLLTPITDMGGTFFIVLITIVVALYGWWRYRSFQVAAYMITVAVAQSLVNNGLKWLVDRERPDISQLTGHAGSSFPSGHSAAAAATYAAIAFVLSLGASTRTRAMLGGVGAAIAVAVGASRALLGVHWLTDVIAGLAVGWLCFIAVSVAFGGRLLRFGQPAEEVGGAGSSAAPRSAGSSR